MNAPRFVLSVHRDHEHRFSKRPARRLRIIQGIGVEGDAHAGEKVQHLSRVRADPNQPNLRQVHLMHAELFDELAASGFVVKPGNLGENITTSGIDLLGLGRDTLLRIGPDVVLKVTGLRNPCRQIEAFAPGLLKEVAIKTEHGIVRKAGIMTIAVAGGHVAPGDAIAIEPPKGPHIPLERV
ncbi:MAG: MOSC domain-containing protein [Erythrobacter sp.]|nr:MOSC domain-containing protein [Erythrobacter sp.]